MFKLITDYTLVDNENYKPPSFFIQKNLVYPPSYFIKLDPYVSYLAKEEIILVILDYVRQIKFLTTDLNQTIANLNQRQINYIDQNLSNSSVDVELRCLYESNVIYTNKAASLIAAFEKKIAEITVIINNNIKALNRKFNNIFSLYDGSYQTVDTFATNLQLENEALPLSYFEV